MFHYDPTDHFGTSLRKMFQDGTETLEQYREKKERNSEKKQYSNILPSEATRCKSSHFSV